MPPTAAHTTIHATLGRITLYLSGQPDTFLVVHDGAGIGHVYLGDSGWEQAPSIPGCVTAGSSHTTPMAAAVALADTASRFYAAHPNWHPTTRTYPDDRMTIGSLVATLAHCSNPDTPVVVSMGSEGWRYVKASITPGTNPDGPVVAFTLLLGDRLQPPAS